MDIKIRRSIHEIDARAWNELTDGNPFQHHAFFAALEDNDCLAPSTGWYPRYICLYDGDELVGGMSAFIKTHSMGEYVYDFSWARTAQQYGLDYYPKMIVAAPFSPVEGQRIHAKNEAARKTLMAALPNIAQAHGCEGAHVLFPTKEESTALKTQGAMVREAFQFQWHNEGYGDFDDYLSALRSRRRKEVRRERRSVEKQGISIRVHEGKEIPSSYDREIFDLYRRTVEQYHYNQMYLNQGFFHQLMQTMPEHLVFFGAYKDEHLIAGAFCMRDETKLFGRYWGSKEDVPHLHFETSLYAPIEWAIREKIQTIEPGAGGEHKFSRGFLPTKTYSAHWHFHPDFHYALDDFCGREAVAIDQHIHELITNETPFQRVDHALNKEKE